MTAGVTMETSVDEFIDLELDDESHGMHLHDRDARWVGELETPRRLAINALAREAQEFGLYDATDDPVNRPVRG